MNERFRHCISMSKMLNSDTLLADSGLDANSTAITADRILYNYAREQCQSAALDELFGNPADECFKVINLRHLGFVQFDVGKSNWPPFNVSQ